MEIKDDIISFLCLIDTMHAYPLKKIRFEHYLSRLRPANLKSMCIILVSSLAQVYIYIKPKLLKLPQFSTSALFKKKISDF